VIEIHVLVRVENISVVAVDKIMNCGVETLLIGAAEQEDGAILQDGLQSLVEMADEIIDGLAE
jgi:hypothetical protein